ncbi:MAG: DUF2271 domain-containing protein [Alphaproteobacteria bacterium]
MKHLFTALALSTALVVPGMAMARQVTVKSQMQAYGGNGAYLAFYLTDANGAYVSSLWMAGGQARYYEHLTAFTTAVRGNYRQIDGITGASVGQGQTLTLDINLDDKFFDAGYVLHVDAVAEDMRESPKEIAMPLSGTGASARGRRYIATLTTAF